MSHIGSELNAKLVVLGCCLLARKVGVQTSQSRLTIQDTNVIKPLTTICVIQNMWQSSSKIELPHNLELKVEKFRIW